jgi:redox-sensitive bicupin YhaK (pirin superfamily)
MSALSPALCLKAEGVRAVERVVSSEVAPVGTFTVRRALPERSRHSVGPWVFLDHFGPFQVTPGESVRLANAGSAPLKVLLLGGAPAEGPLVFHGPFVMNSVDQVRAAEIAFRTGRMGSLA